jgi:hypothetical protein
MASRLARGAPGQTPFNWRTISPQSFKRLLAAIDPPLVYLHQANLSNF